MKNKSIRPGKPFLDTEGKRIQAHGGSIFFDAETGIFYLYGENKEYTVPGSGVWTWGVRAYASRDLYNWEDKGLILPPVLDDPDSPLNPRTACLDRPHILFNRKTGKYVCWMKIMHKNDNRQQTETVAVADSFLGPYTIVRSGLRPLGMNAGDFDLAADGEGKAYSFFEHVHSELICAELTADYTDVTGVFSRHFPRPYPPFVREGPAHFERKGRHYLITSGTTGYFPNRSEVAVAESWHGPYTVLGDPHPGDPSGTSFHSQVSSVFKVPWKKDLYIALADRWMPTAMDIPAAFCEEIFEGFFSGRVPLSEGEQFRESLIEKYGLQSRRDVLVQSETDTSVADYVWLPLRFQEPCPAYPDGMVFIDWLDEWRIEDFE